MFEIFLNKILNFNDEKTIKKEVLIEIDEFNFDSVFNDKNNKNKSINFKQQSLLLEIEILLTKTTKESLFFKFLINSYFLINSLQKEPIKTSITGLLNY